jgi:nitroimidazol reductase NimA-like FMN-containing flavoprotein (pyridoxamine 5'-phosphate oxidase superfamily)
MTTVGSPDQRSSQSPADMPEPDLPVSGGRRDHVRSNCQQRRDQYSGDAPRTTAPSSVDVQLEELSQAECRLLIGITTVGRVGFVIDGRPIVLPVNFRSLSDESGLWIVLLTRPGNVIDGASEHVVFEIDGIDHDHRQGWSVLVQGALHHVDPDMLFERFKQRFDPMAWMPQGRTSWLAIKSRTVTGRRLQTPEREWALMRSTLSTAG